MSGITKTGKYWILCAFIIVLCAPILYAWRFISKGWCEVGVEAQTQTLAKNILAIHSGEFYATNSPPIKLGVTQCRIPPQGDYIVMRGYRITNICDNGIYAVIPANSDQISVYYSWRTRFPREIIFNIIDYPGFKIEKP